MGLLDALSGRVEHFNKVAVPALNDIFSKIKDIPDEAKKQIFTTCLIIAEHGVDLFFKPGVGPAIKDVKQYSQSHFERLYAIFIIWVFHDFCNLGLLKLEEDSPQLEAILAIDKEDYTNYLKQLKHGTKNPVGLDKLWDEVVRIIHTMPDTQENYLVFAREFSKICRTTLQ